MSGSTPSPQSEDFESLDDFTSGQSSTLSTSESESSDDDMDSDDSAKPFKYKLLHLLATLNVFLIPIDVPVTKPAGSRMAVRT